MSEQRSSYATVGVNDDREEPVIVIGKRNVSFEVGSEEFDRTAILKLPEEMTVSEFNRWKSQSGIDLIDMYFHCLHQKPLSDPEPADDRENEALTDGGQDLPEQTKAQLLELRRSLNELGDWLAEQTDNEVESMADLYASDMAREEAQRSIEMEGFSLHEPEYEELLGNIEMALHNAQEPIVIGSVSRLLINLILANPEAYERHIEFRQQRHEELKDEIEEGVSRAAAKTGMTKRYREMHDEEEMTDIPIEGNGGPEEENDGG